jgi:hypothetical protein
LVLNIRHSICQRAWDTMLQALVELCAKLQSNVSLARHSSHRVTVPVNEHLRNCLDGNCNYKKNMRIKRISYMQNDSLYFIGQK